MITISWSLSLSCSLSLPQKVTDPVFLTIYSADVSDDLKDLLFKMLDKNPETRITVPQIQVSVSKPFTDMFICGVGKLEMFSTKLNTPDLVFRLLLCTGLSESLAVYVQQ